MSGVDRYVYLMIGRGVIALYVDAALPGAVDRCS
jgi:hypothetical protein